MPEGLPLAALSWTVSRRQSVKTERYVNAILVSVWQADFCYVLQGSLDLQEEHLQSKVKDRDVKA